MIGHKRSEYFVSITPETIKLPTINSTVPTMKRNVANDIAFQGIFGGGHSNWASEKPLSSVGTLK